MKLDITRQLFQRSDRVKAVDLHPTEPWVIASLYTGTVTIWNYALGTTVKSFEVTDVPIRAVRFIPRKSQFICGADDFHVRVYNYSTGAKVAGWEAHPDYIRVLAVHPTLPYVLSAGDDMTIKLWNWDDGWRCERVYEGHAHYVMSLAWNPKDANVFASACLDRTVKVWSLGSSTANFTIEAHQRGVNYVDYYHGGDKPYLLTSSDDGQIRVWDYQTKGLVSSLSGHTSNVSFAIFHPSLPIILSGSEDGSIKIWHSSTYRLLQTLNYGLERAWCISYLKSTNSIALGFDEGVVVSKLGREGPVGSMDQSGKIIFARNTQILGAAIRDTDVAEKKDGEKILLQTRELGMSEVYPGKLTHSPNGRFVTLTGDGEYIIYTALAWRNKAFGSALDFVWARDSNGYAIREASGSIRVYKAFKERAGWASNVTWEADGLWGGELLAVGGKEWVGLFDWESGALVRRIDVAARDIWWSESGELLVIATDESFYVLRFHRELYAEAVENGNVDADEGVEDAFEVIAEVSEAVRSGEWIGDCFVYTNTANRLNYLVGDQTHTISHFDSGMYMLGYIPRDGRVYLADKDVNVVSYQLSLGVVEYQTLVLRGDMDAAAELLPTIPEEQVGKLSRFLEGQGFKELALDIATDPEQRFDLALQLARLDVAIEIARAQDLEAKWKTVGDAALLSWDLALAEECYVNAKDLGSLLLLYSSTGDSEGMRKVAELAVEGGANNVAFAALLSTGETNGCVDLLTKTGRVGEAALFAKTYVPSRLPGVVDQWKEDLGKKERKRLAEMIANPRDDEELFEDWKEVLDREAQVAKGENLIDISEVQAPEAETEQEVTEETVEGDAIASEDVTAMEVEETNGDGAVEADEEDDNESEGKKDE
ncbi:hypothetical protein G7K_1476-t1 [Saitoella complicata NRRL Y-17804]|uniref:Coatomer subunit beta' n=1 Tax=Saitoella complicata (strain BCRC 22490 / CBS 7301 / JCM 7358 / NBRC 10748 / NRRL Y-17804) TaxID=698492 RepID=A0A0E9NC14_SAICN|nr:hypothetical protein G7K_1476-t1 [Saitoella complicata NRRL Y-17804]